MAELNGFCSEIEQNPEIRALWGEQPEPVYRNVKERFWHREVAYQLAEGRTHIDIGASLGKSPVTIGYLAKQEWMKQQVLEIIHGSGDKAMRKLHDAAELAADTLIEAMKKASESKNLDQMRKTANDVLNRKYGAPNQPYTVQNIPANQMSDEDLAKAVQN
jgi:hypothetical protein